MFLKCHIESSGNVLPVFEWSKNGIAIGEDAILNFFDYYHHNTDFVEFMFSRFEASDNGATFILKVKQAVVTGPISFTLNVLREHYYALFNA